MNLKLNEEQIAYVNGLEDPEAKKDFLINCFLTQCKEAIQEGETENYLNFDLPKNNREKFDKFIEDNGLKKFVPVLEFFSKEEVDQMNQQSNSNFNNYFVDTKSCVPESLSKEQLKGKHLWIINGTGFKFTDSSSIVTKAPAKPLYFGTINMKQYEYLANHRYTKEDLEKAFNESRLTNPIIGFKHNDFEEYFKTT